MKTIADTRWVLTDAIVAKLLKGKVRIEGKFYFVDPNQEDLIVGDVVLDRGDGAWGVIDFIMLSSLNSKNIELQCAVRSQGCIECGVPMCRLIRLKSYPEVEAN